MTDLTGRKPKNTYKDLLQVPNSNSGIDATLRAVEDGEGSTSPLEISTGAVNISGTTALQLNGTTALASGLLKHEVGGLEANISAVADGDLIVGTGAGSVALRAGALTGGASGFLKHEVGGLEADISAIVDGDFIVGTGTGTLGLESGATARTSLGLGTAATKDTVADGGKVAESNVAGNPLTGEIIESGTVSSASELDITDLPSWARKIVVEFDDLAPATDDVTGEILTSSDNGANFDTGASDYAFNRKAFRVGGSIVASGNNATSAYPFGGGGENFGNDPNPIRGRIILNNPGDTGQQTGIECEVHYFGSANNYSWAHTHGQRREVAKVDAIRVKMSSGNIASMNYTVYAFRKS